MSLEIRALIDADARTYRALRLEALERDPRAFGRSLNEYRRETQQTIRARLVADGAVTIGAFDAQALVGMASLVRQSGEKVRHKADIFAVYVTESARGRGISRMLLTDLLERARSTPELEQVQVSVSVTQHVARALYTSLGFAVYGLERRALKIGDEYVDYEHMMLALKD